MHLLSALAHRVGVTLAQHAVADKTNEIAVVTEFLRQIILEGRVVTVDALLTQRAIASQIVEAGGDSVMYVKDNQPQLREAITTVFVQAPIRPVGVSAGYGSVSQCSVWSHALSDSCVVPFLQACTDFVGENKWLSTAMCMQWHQWVMLVARLGR